MRILAIDDEPVFCELLTLRLGELGLSDVETAFTGPDALQRVSAAEEPFECFLVDVRMMPMDGIELVRRLRAMPHHHATPIIMISALTDKASIDAAFMAGANDYITKPLDTVELKIRLEMAKSILVEREQARLLHEHVLKQESMLYQKGSFDDEIRLEDVESAISLLSMENFLLKQGNVRLRQSCAVGFHLPMAETYFDMMDPTYYAVLIADIAVAVSKSLSAYPHMLVYPGSGDLVAVLLDQPRPDRFLLEGKLEDELAKLRMRYAAADMSLPDVCLGEPARVRLFPAQCPTTLIRRARDSARGNRQQEFKGVFKEIA